MEKKLTLLILTAFIFFLNACQKDLEVFVPEDGQIFGPDTTWYNGVSDVMPIGLLRNNLLPDVDTGTINVSNGDDTVTTASGLQCIFPANGCVNSAGVPVTGKINVELSLVDKKGDMVRMNRPTTSGNRLLVSGGEVYLRLKKEDEDLSIAPNARIAIKYPSTLPDTSMKFFTGLEANALDFDWLANPDVANNSVTAGGLTSGYEIVTNRLRWYHCAYFFDTVSITRSKVMANIPSNYTNANTSVYIVFKDIFSVVGLSADMTIRKFISPMLPDGKEATMVVLSLQGKDLFFGKKTFTIGGNIPDLQTVDITPVKTSLADINNYLDHL